MYENSKKEYFCLNNSVKVTYNEYNDELKLEYFETKPIHIRPLFIDITNTILSLFDSLQNVTLEDLNINSSFFSILWSPVKSSNSKFLSQMLVFYQFNYKNENFANVYDYNFLETIEFPIIGILPIKFDEKIWLNKINNCKYFRYFNKI